VACGLLPRLQVPRHFNVNDEGHDEGHHGEAHKDAHQETRKEGLSEARSARKWAFVKSIYRKKRDIPFLEVPSYKADVPTYLP
jgi:hypothetical protein